MSPLNLLIYFSLLLRSSYAQLITGEKGFSLELIHIDSKRSPFYNANLTDFQRIVRSIDRSKSYVLWLESTMIDKANLTTVIRPPLHVKPPAIFMVAVSIGSGNGFRNYYLQMDTGSGLTWTQCLPCHRGFPQSAPMFDPRSSPTYRVVGCDDPVCSPPRYKCVDNRCEYDIRYLDNTFINGTVSRETFSFQDAHASHRVAIRNLLFGCTHSSNMNYHGNPAGIFSMSQSPTSMVKQLATQTDGLFSYCFSPPETAHTSFLDVEDISFNGRRMHFPGGTFTRQSDGTSSFFIDSGATVTHLTTYAFDRVENVMKDYFRLRLNLRPVNDSSLPFRLCYKMMPGIDKEQPTMTPNNRTIAATYLQAT